MVLPNLNLTCTESAAFTKETAFGKWVVILHPNCKSDSIHIILFMSNNMQLFHNSLFRKNPSWVALWYRLNLDSISIFNFTAT